ncbi:MAG: hypothetical protein R3D34_16280 [Nitratireductor sp.]
MRPTLSAVVAAWLSVSASALPATAGDNEKPMVMAQACGWYAVVGCARGWNQANSDAPPGTYVIDTNQYPNFRNGWFCAVDGPYGTKAEVPLSHWRSYRGDAYVKNAC